MAGPVGKGEAGEEGFGTRRGAGGGNSKERPGESAVGTWVLLVLLLVELFVLEAPLTDKGCIKKGGELDSGIE